MSASLNPESPQADRSTPTLSVVVLNYNYGRFLGGCLESILSQTFTDFELIVIDDCSKDDSRTVVAPFLKDPRVRFVPHETNAGFLNSLVEGTEQLSRGEFLSVVSADDFVARSDAFETQIELLRRHPSAAFCFSAVEIVTPTDSGVDRSFEDVVALGPEEALQAIFGQVARPAASGTIIRKTHYYACGGYRRDIAMALDLAMWVALAIQGGFVYTPLPLYGYRIHSSQMSSALPGIKKNAREVYQILAEGWREGKRRGFRLPESEQAVFVAHFEAHAIHEAFNRGPRVAASRIWATVQNAPIQSLRSSKLWISALRVAIGRRAFDALRSVASLVRRTA